MVAGTTTRWQAQPMDLLHLHASAGCSYPNILTKCLSGVGMDEQVQKGGLCLSAVWQPFSCCSYSKACPNGACKWLTRQTGQFIEYG